MPEPSLFQRLDEIRAVIAERKRLAGLTHEVKIVAVTKTHSAAAVIAASAAGLDAVGENRVQEALPKQNQTLDLKLEWHLIGSLQRNKVRQASGRFEMIHSVDRPELAAEIDRCASSGARQSVLLQVNCSGEPQKSGVTPEALPALVESTQAMPNLNVCGLMTMAEFTTDETVQRRAFALLRTLRDQLTTKGFYLPELSMGMSSDFPAAVQEGATMLRLGTALFGPRAIA